MSTSRTGARLKPDQRIAALVATARELLAEVGYERFLPAEVARRAGVSEATVYRYFPTKRELLVRVAEEWLDEVLGAEPVVAHIDTTYERLSFVVRHAVGVIRKEPALTRYIFNELRPDPGFRSTAVYQLNQRIARMVGQVLRDAIASGEFRDDISIDLLRDVVFGAIEHQAFAYLRGEGDFSIDETTEGITRLIYRGMTPGPSDPST
ncbi:MAG TPA: TetR/AcrR family transcriptional regulator [Pseudonocardia sp.]|jgi:AcrR family transcriptional regulator